MANKFAGFNQLRKNTVARMRGGSTGDGHGNSHSSDGNAPPPKVTPTSKQESGRVPEQGSLLLQESSPAIASNTDTTEGNKDFGGNAPATTKTLDDDAVVAPGKDDATNDSPGDASVEPTTSAEAGDEGHQKKADIAQV